MKTKHALLIVSMTLAIAVGAWLYLRSEGYIESCCHSTAELRRLEVLAMNDTSGNKAAALARYHSIPSLGSGTVNEAEAIKWYEVAAERGLTQAQLALGTAYTRQAIGNCFHEGPATRARHWLQAAQGTNGIAGSAAADMEALSAAEKKLPDCR